MLIHKTRTDYFKVISGGHREDPRIIVIRPAGLPIVLAHFSNRSQGQRAVFIGHAQTVVVIAIRPLGIGVVITGVAHQRNLETLHRRHFDNSHVAACKILRRKSAETCHTDKGFHRVKSADQVKVAAGTCQTADVAEGKIHLVITDAQIGLTVKNRAFRSHFTRVRTELVFKRKADGPAVAEIFLTGNAPDGIPPETAFHRERILAFLVSRVLATRQGSLVLVENTRRNRTVKRNLSCLNREGGGAHRHRQKRCLEFGHLLSLKK